MFVLFRQRKVVPFRESVRVVGAGDCARDFQFKNHYIKATVFLANQMAPSLVSNGISRTKIASKRRIRV